MYIHAGEHDEVFPQTSTGNTGENSRLRGAKSYWQRLQALTSGKSLQEQPVQCMSCLEAAPTAGVVLTRGLLSSLYRICDPLSRLALLCEIAESRKNRHQNRKMIRTFVFERQRLQKEL